MLNRPGVLGGVILLVTFVVLMVTTIIRYWDRNAPSTDKGASVGHGASQDIRRDVRWQDLPQVKPFELVDRNTQPIDSEVFDGQPWVASFFFSRCPSVCKKQNEAIQRLQLANRENGTPTMFVSISCDPAYDTPEVLDVYAKGFNADPKTWKFLTGALDKVQAIGLDSFGLPVGPETHSTSLLLVDKWGRFRDRFNWEEPKELELLGEALEACRAETSPPVDAMLKSRVASASALEDSHSDANPHGDSAATGDEAWRDEPWINSFQLVDADGEKFGTSELDGNVWVANTFFTRCPTICKKLMAEVNTLRLATEGKPVTYVSISSDPVYDTPQVLSAFQTQWPGDSGNWKLLTGDPLYSRRIMSEYFGMAVALDSPIHDEHLFAIDKWGNKRGKFKYDDGAALVELRQLLDKLVLETEPPTSSNATSEEDEIENESEPSSEVSVGSGEAIEG